MRMTDLLEKKAQKQALTKQEINYIITNYVNKTIPDYQMAALLMAIRLNGMTDQETVDLTETMMHSGKVLDWSFLNTTIVDKHSTGGVGDKTSIALTPLLASMGLTVAKMSGRGLGHTGGTIDKLETISGFRVTLNDKEFKENVKNHKIALVGQDKELVPADKLIYALRDVTATNPAMPLIVSSIMSKKLATGSNIILLDVKCGSGALMKNVEQATNLAQAMIKIGKNLGRKVLVEITNMQQPLGRAIGNKNEVLEAVDTLKGKGPEEFTKLVYSSASTILMAANKAKDVSEATKMIDEAISSGKALDKFKEWIKAQGGNVEEIFEPNWLHPKYSVAIKSNSDGYFVINSALEFGEASVKLGAGRETKESLIDNEAGIYLDKVTNEKVTKGETVFTLYSSKPISDEIVQSLQNSWKITDKPIKNDIILKKLD